VQSSRHVMRPLLFEIPLPEARLSLWPALLGVALVVGLLAAVTFHKSPAAERRGLAFPASLAAALLVAAFLYRDRVLVVGPVEVGGFGAMLALSLGVGAWLLQRAAARRGLPRDASATVGVVAVVAGIVGARVVYALLHASELGGPLGVLAFFDGGLVAHGALAFGGAAAFVAARRLALPPLAWLDAASPGLALGVVLTRFGCWLEGCDFGRLLGAGAPRFVARLGTFPAGSPAWVEQVSTQVIVASSPAALPVHPAELYEALAGALLVGLVLVVERRKSRAGASALAVLAGYASLRVLVDFTRPVTPEVWLGRAVVLAGVLAAGVAFARARRPARTGP
jgi:phosphatidylglycerol---prolipoprotein diacylglyceryl transferase